MVTIGATPEKALHDAGVVERTAEIVWGARALGAAHPLPEQVNADFANVYRFMRENGL
jgi:L-fuculose-phosphate aldolase